MQRFLDNNKPGKKWPKTSTNGKITNFSGHLRTLLLTIVIVVIQFKHPFVCIRQDLWPNNITEQHLYCNENSISRIVQNYKIVYTCTKIWDIQELIARSYILLCLRSYIPCLQSHWDSHHFVHLWSNRANQPLFLKWMMKEIRLWRSMWISRFSKWVNGPILKVFL